MFQFLLFMWHSSARLPFNRSCIPLGRRTTGCLVMGLPLNNDEELVLVRNDNGVDPEASCLLYAGV